MADGKSITKNDLLDALAEFYHGILKPEFSEIRNEFDKKINGLRKETRTGFKAVEKRFAHVDGQLDKVEMELSGLKDEVKGLKADLSDVPSRRELNELKQRVDVIETQRN